MKEIFESLKDQVEPKEEKFPYMDRNKYVFERISKENFFTVDQSIKNDRKDVYFIDGGHQDIILSSSFSISYNKICAARFQDNKKKEVILERFWITCVLKRENDKLFYIVRSFSDKIDISLKIDAYDSSISENRRRIKPERISSLARKLCEIILAKNICYMNEGSFIVLDGILLANSKIEKDEFSSLYSIARKNGNVICSLAKTSNLVTDSGRPLSFAVEEITQEKIWQYSVARSITENHEAVINLVRLHNRSDYVFRFEILKDSSKEIGTIISLLQKNSCDPVFFGYPYGLVLVDDLARVSNKEKEYFKTALLANAKGDYKKLIDLSRTSDAHSILDNIRF